MSSLMLMYETVPPTTPTPAAAASYASCPRPPMEPMWLGVPLCVLGCVPLVLVIGYWMKKVACESVIKWSVVSVLASVAIGAALYVSNASYRRQYDDYMRFLTSSS